MVEETFLQHWIFTRFALPFLLVFFIIFAILEKTKLFGDDKKQLNALISFVVGLIFVGVVYPTLVVENLILFLIVAIVSVFVIMLLWGFIFGTGNEKFTPPDWMKWVLGILVGVAALIGIFWATGLTKIFAGIFTGQSWSNAFWTNLVFILVIAAALAVILISARKGGGGKSK